jgi:hypothetical protein
MRALLATVRQDFNIRTARLVKRISQDGHSVEGVLSINAFRDGCDDPSIPSQPGLVDSDAAEWEWPVNVTKDVSLVFLTQPRRLPAQLVD